MSDYLENLARRASGKQNFLQPRVPSLFEPAFSQELLISSIVPAEDAFRLRSSGQRRREAIETTDLDADVVRSGDMPLTNLPIKLMSTVSKNSAGCLIADTNDEIAPLESDRIEKDPEELAGKSAPIALRDLQHSGENQRADDNQSDEAKPPAIGKDDGATGLDYGNLHDAPPQKYGVWNSQHTGHLRQMGNPPQSRHHQQTENSEMIFSKIDKSYLESSVSERSNENGGNMESGTEKRRALGSQLMEPNLMGSFRQNENSVLPGEKLVSSQELMHDIIASSPAFKIEQPKKLQKPIVASQEQSGQIQPSIKVTIGRIEVRAVKPPEKRVERRETNPPSSSLDDYLASLRGRSR
ncbi:MAG: hypothetical protein A4E49_01098 [Methanosaeta sp. PtaU1.Bin112]|nr:MAG: hypothetical protein A4E49_01098 [Methanosaeta sp. PtaU1.Bin112]